MSTRHNVKSLLGAGVTAALNQPTVSGIGLPAKVYFNPEIFEAECDRVFPRAWVAAGVASDIPKPGDATLVTIARRNVILLRGRDRRVRGFYNACRHRGMKLLCEPAKNLRSITCPFHHWTYGLDGSLRGTPYLGGVGEHKLEGFERESLGLIPVSIGEWCNTLFVNLDGQAPPLEEHLAPLLAHLGGDRDWAALYHHKPGSIKEEQIKGNWKEYVEVSLEEYHLKFAHPEVFKGVDPLAWRDDPVIDRHMWGSQAQLSGSYGAGYKYYSGAALPRWLERGKKWHSYVMLFPNLGIFATSDQLSIDYVLPLSPALYNYRQEFYFAGSVKPETTHKGAIQAAMAAWDLLMSQDAALLEGLRDTQCTNQYIGNRARFAGRWEVNVHRFQQHYLRSLLNDAR
jgi:choline monooxygenase